MRLHLMSDLHLDHDPIADAEFLERLKPQPDIDALILAGDWYSICRPKETKELFQKLLDLYEQVIVVPGNHDYWNVTPAEAERAMLAQDSDRLHVLFNDYLHLKGQEFYGGAMFYPTPGPGKRRDFIDGRKIIAPETWAFDQFRTFSMNLEELFYDGQDLSNTIVITHHLPHPNSTPPKFRGSPTDHFFMTNMIGVITNMKPKMWLHGHTHDPFDYVIEKTRVICNPRGYPFEHEARDPYEPKLIEV
jgi:predicted phosphodiesterase